MFWSCNLLWTFWNSVIDIKSLCLDIHITISPRLCLLGTGNMDPWHVFQKKYIDPALIAAKKCITIPWKSDYPLTVSHWLNEISSCIPLDKIYHNLRCRSREFFKVWQPHLDFMAKRAVSGTTG